MLDTSVLMTLSFITGMALILAAIILCWDLIRSAMRGSNLRPLFFSAGVLTVTFSFFITDISKVFVYPVWLYVMVALGYAMIAGSLMVKKWDCLIFLTLILPIAIPRNSIWYVFVVIPVIWIAEMTYRHFCIITCTSFRHLTTKQDRFTSDSWAAIISLFAVLSSSYLLLGILPNDKVVALVLLINILIKIAVTIVMLTLVVRFVKFSRRELVVFPIIMAFIVLSTTGIFFISGILNNFVQSQYKEDVRSNTDMFKYIAEQAYPGDLLATKIQQKSPELNDLADRVFLDSDVRGTFFLGNVRVASAPSSVNNERNLGSRIEDKNVKKVVLEEGHQYTGSVIKDGQLVVATYVPVSKDGKVIGMIASGKNLSNFDHLREQTMYAIIAGGAVTLVIILSSVFFESRKNLVATKRK